MPRWFDVRIVLLAVFFGLLTTLGFDLGVLGGVLAAGGALVAGTAVTVLTGSRPDPRPVPAPAPTAQARLLADIGAAVGHIDALAAEGTLVPAVQAQADDAGLVGRSALSTATRVAAAVDRVDEAERRLTAVGTTVDSPSLRRLHERRALLVGQLEATGARLIGVYTELVETNATLATSTLVGADEAEALATVSTGLDDLRTIAAELADLGRREPPGA